jgi:predicted Zn-ribbon and HTH transcriptional regulator
MTEIQDIIKEYGDNYKKHNDLPYNKLKALESIEVCRTDVLGKHVDDCEDCGHKRISYNSCKNRHCPKCQSFKKEEWIEARKAEVINVKYFHVVFTLPHSLNELLYQNQKTLYPLFFKCVAETLKELALDKKYLGAQIGIISVLHTWGQTLPYHPHIHCIVPGGGLSANGTEFKHSKKKFFIPVKVLSRKFRGKFLYYLSKEVKSNALNIAEDMDYSKLKNNLYNSEWVVYCKKPFKNSLNVISYLAKYVYRVAISNNRIIECKDNKVKFKYRDYRDNNKEKIMVLDVDEFIRRFLLHVLPYGFTKIRYYGILGNRNKKGKLLKCQILTKSKLRNKKLTKRELLKKILGKDIFCCECCGSDRVNRYFVPYTVKVE